MKGNKFLFMLAMTIALISALLFNACPAPAPTTITPGPAPAPTPTQPPSPTPLKWEWPRFIFMSGAGASETAKLVSWGAVLEATTGMTVRVVTDALHIGTYEKVKKKETSLAIGDQHDLRGFLEARDDYARRDLGPWPVRIAWLGSIANAGFIVRGDSPIKEPKDLKPGVKFSVWNMAEITLSVPRGLAAWANLTEKDIVFFNAGSTEGAMRAIADGRADIAFAPATMPVLMEVASSPRGIGWIALDASKDPEGARRFQVHFPTAFAPMITNATKEGLGVWGMVEWKHDIVHADLPVDLVYNLAKWLDDNYDRYKDKHASNVFMTLDNLVKSLETTFLPAHDGLIKYLKEKGKWTAAHDARQKTNLSRLQAFIDAYPKAIALAEQKGIKVDPTNNEWLRFWTQYKIDNKIPRFVMHPSLEQDGPVVLFTEAQMPPPAPPPAPPTPTPATPALPPPKVEGDIKFELVSVTSPVKADQDISVVINTEPGVTGTIMMWFSDGQPSSFTFRGKETRTADANGRLVFQGTMFSHVIPGTARLEISLRKEMRSGKATVYFEIQ